MCGCVYVCVVRCVLRYLCVSVSVSVSVSVCVCLSVVVCVYLCLCVALRRGAGREGEFLKETRSVKYKISGHTCSVCVCVHHTTHLSLRLCWHSCVCLLTCFHFSNSWIISGVKLLFYCCFTAAFSGVRRPVAWSMRRAAPLPSLCDERHVYETCGRGFQKKS